MEKIKSHFIKNSGIWLLVAIPVLTSIVYAILLPVSVDEAATFLLFTNTGIMESATTYPAPNNHILHSVITNFTKHLPYLSDLFKLRISSIVVNLVTLLVLYKFVSKHFNKKLAFVLKFVFITRLCFQESFVYQLGFSFDIYGFVFVTEIMFKLYVAYRALGLL